MPGVVLRIFRGTRESGNTEDYRVPVAPGMVVLDAIHYVQNIMRRTWRSAGTAKQESADRARQK